MKYAVNIYYPYAIESITDLELGELKYYHDNILEAKLDHYTLFINYMNNRYTTKVNLYKGGTKYKTAYLDKYKEKRKELKLKHPELFI